MRTIKRASLPLFLVLLGVFACALPGVSQVDQSALDTAVAETLAAIIQQTREAGSGVSLDFTATPTLPLTGTVTVTPTFTATLPATFTPLPPLTPMVSVSVPTNCRLGQGKEYKMVGALMVGELAQAYARDPSGDYWYIRNPDSPSQFCWIWGEYATVSGAAYSLPIFTPPPSPTPSYTPTPQPDFDAAYSALQKCAGWYVDISLKNTGTLTFRSISLTVKDTVTATVVTSVTDGFTDRTACSTITYKDTLLPGKTVIHSSPKFAYNINGHKLRATITLCGGTGLSGRCVANTIVFTP